MRFLFNKQCGGCFLAFIGLGLLLFSMVGNPYRACAAEGQNELLSISVDRELGPPIVHLQTQNPVGYRYTVYDSFDPVRVVIDFPGMDVSTLDESITVDTSPLQGIRVSSFELTSGTLGRVELLLTNAASYDVSLSENDFQISFTQIPKSPASSADVAELASSGFAPPPTSPEVVAVQSLVGGSEAQPAQASQVEASTTMAEPVASARRIESIEIKKRQAFLKADGKIEKHQYFSLGAPPRLVVDVYGVQPGFKERSHKAGMGFKQVRIGTYKDKTRFVFDADGTILPQYSVASEENAIVVSWGDEAATVSKQEHPPVGVPVTVEAVEFLVEKGKSVLSVALSGPTEVSEPTAEGDIVRFGVKNANISRSLRRSIDASVFPSSVRLVTPYTILAGDKQDVLFAVELKGPTSYDLRREGDRLLFEVDNGPFAEAVPSDEVIMKVPATGVSDSAAPETVMGRFEEKTPEAAEEKPLVPVVKDVPTSVETAAVSEKGPAYTGEKITLVFDDADIRRIFQLLGEVSNLNVLVGDEVKGTITLRLIDVPWDQALDLILDTKDLGMLREGNVVRILPKDKIRAMRQDELKAVTEERSLEPLVTEVVSVSYTDLGNVSGAAGELLTDRGKITPDNRNKQLIVTDIPAVIAEVRKLVAILDTPEKQVMIEARIVEARRTFTRDLGISWNFQYAEDGVDDVSELASAGVSGGGSFVLTPSVGTAGLGSSFTFGQLGISASVLDLRLSAAETADNARVISKPRVATLNGETAVISQGTQIPYQSVSDQGTKTEFVTAALELNVTPVINPDNSIILEIQASNNTPTTVTGASAPGIDTKEATTKMLVTNGETTVIGGIFTESESDSENGIPLLRKLPIIGYLFKSTNKSRVRSELLIFITPRILN